MKEELQEEIGAILDRPVEENEMIMLTQVCLFAEDTPSLQKGLQLIFLASRDNAEREKLLSDAYITKAACTDMNIEDIFKSKYDLILSGVKKLKKERFLAEENIKINSFFNR